MDDTFEWAFVLGLHGRFTWNEWLHIATAQQVKPRAQLVSTECWAGVVVGKQSERPPPSPGLQLQSPHLSWVILICQNCLPACLQGYYWCVMREQIGNEKHTNGRWKKQRWEEERGWVDNVGGSFMQKEAGNDLLFHLFLRINYAKMLIGDIMNFSICYE